MLIEVLHLVDGSVQSHVFVGKAASRQMGPSGAQILFRDGSGRDHVGRKVISAQYAHAEMIITYDEDEIG
jgi:hypothetical protein